MTNNVNITISTADQTAITTAITAIQTKLSPKLLALTDEERISTLKMGDKSVAFVQKAQTYGGQFSAQMPSYIDLVALGVDVNLVTLLNNYHSQLSTLLRGIEDTMMLAGGEAMEASNAVYAALKMAAHNNIAGTQDAVNDMKARYPNRPKTTPTPPPAAH